MEKQRIVVVTGPTASGKTGFAIDLALALGGELVSADSMQIYRGLDIGSAKPTTEERARVPHHLIDIADVDEAYHAGRFREDAMRAIADIASRSCVPIVVGGTALYIKVLLSGLAEGPGRDEAVRRSLEEAWDGGGKEELLRRLTSVDPESAGRLHPNDRTRIVRALEIFEVSGRKASELRNSHGFAEEPYEPLIFCMEVERSELYRRIEARVDEMVRMGFADEVRRALECGYSSDLPPLKSIGYLQMCSHIEKGVPLDETVLEIKKATRHFARRQLTWMRKFDAVWIRPDEVDRGVKIANEFLCG